MRFIRRLSVKHHPTGDHFQLSIPAQVAQALGLHEAGGLVSIEIVNKIDTNKKAKAVRLQAYRDTPIIWREAFNPAIYRSPTEPLFKGVPVPPNTLGRSRPTGCGKVLDVRATCRDTRAALRYLQTVVKHRAFPHGYKRGPKPKRRW